MNFQFSVVAVEVDAEPVGRAQSYAPAQFLSSKAKGASAKADAEPARGAFDCSAFAFPVFSLATSDGGSLRIHAGGGALQRSGKSIAASDAL